MTGRFKIIILAAIFCISLSCSAFAAPWVNMKLTYDYSQHNYSAEAVYIKLNGNELKGLTMPPIIMNSVTLVPARDVLEPLGAVVDWKKDTEEIFIAYEDSISILKIGSDSANCNGITKKMTVAPKIINNKTMIPVRFVSEALGFKVSWVDPERTIYITSPESYGSELDSSGSLVQPAADSPIGQTVTETSETTTESTSVSVPLPSEQGFVSPSGELSFNENFYYDRNMNMLVFSSEFILGGVSAVTQSSDLSAKKSYFRFKVADPSGISSGRFSVDDENISSLEVQNNSGDVTLCFTAKKDVGFKVYEDGGSIYFKAYT